MAGGMGRPWSAPLADRVASHPAAVRDPHPPRQHCWVTDPPGHPGVHAGLLLEWRREQSGWRGLVAYVVPDPADTCVWLVQRWLPAAHLTPLVRPG